MAECSALAEWAEEHADRGGRVPASQEEIEDCLEYLAAALPSKNIDAEAGYKRFTVYVAVLGNCTVDELRHMSLEAIRTLDWFPTAKQCLGLVASFLPPVSERDRVLRICGDFAQASFDQWLENIRNGQPIGDVPERWMRIAVERGAMRVLSDGRFVSRALYHGPVRSISAVVRMPADVVEGCVL